MSIYCSWSDCLATTEKTEKVFPITEKRPEKGKDLKAEINKHFQGFVD